MVKGLYDISKSSGKGLRVHLWGCIKQKLCNNQAIVSVMERLDSTFSSGAIVKVCCEEIDVFTKF